MCNKTTTLWTFVFLLSCCLCSNSSLWLVSGSKVSKDLYGERARRSPRVLRVSTQLQKKDEMEVMSGNDSVMCNVPCAEIQRFPCTKPNLCGQCFPGYTGQSLGNSTCAPLDRMILIIVAIFFTVLLLSMAIYCWGGRRNALTLMRLAENMFPAESHRSLLNDSFVGEEWLCSICYHENHPEKLTCIMCGTPKVNTTSILPSPVHAEKTWGGEKGSLTHTGSSTSSREVELSQRNRAFHIRRLNDHSLNLRQAAARRRHMWKRQRGLDGQLRWVKMNPDYAAKSKAHRGTIVGAGACFYTSGEEKNDDQLLNEPRVSEGFVLQEIGEGKKDWKEAEGLELPSNDYTTLCGDKKIDFEAITAMSFNAKTRWFLSTANRILLPVESGHLLLKIRRTHILEDSMHQLMSVPTNFLRERLRIEFCGEPGIDAGGLIREWILLVGQELFSNDLGLFQATHGNDLSYWINPASGNIEYYKFFGLFLAKILLEGHVLTIHPAVPLLKHILKIPISLFDLRFLDEEIYNSLAWIRHNTGVESLCLFFEVYNQELKPNGSNIAVTDENKEEYLNLVLKFYMYTSISRQLSAFLTGLEEVFPFEILQVFDYQELELLMCGLPEIDLVDWKKNTDVQYQGHEKQSKKQVVKWFWEVLEEFSQENRARLLQFATGTSRVPVEGFKALTSNDGRVRRFTLKILELKEGEAALYPGSHTCFNRLDLPTYKSKQQMQTYLSLVRT